MDVSASDLIERSDRLADLAEQRLALAPAKGAAQERARQLRDHLEGFVRPRAADIDREETKWGTLVRKLNLKVE